MVQRHGFRLFSKNNVDTEEFTVVETYPFSAWRSLNFPGLPGKNKAFSEVIQGFFNLLKDRFNLPDLQPSHDELQALVAGLAGISLITNNKYIAHGVEPVVTDKYIYEGYIVNPA
ncbi:MAG: hypothetical protein Kow00111_24050 [Thermincola ferriacetica]